MDEWKEIPGLGGLYKASKSGKILGVKRNKVRKPKLNKHGYMALNLSINGIAKTYTVHQLVMLTFVGSRPTNMQICHNNNNKSDNRLSNLRYDTPSNNNLDKIIHGTHPEVNKTHCPKNHKYNQENTYYRKNGSRQCRVCGREQAASKRKSP